MRNKEKAKVWKASLLWAFWRQASDTPHCFVTVALKLRLQLLPRKRTASILVVISRLYAIFGDILIWASRVPFLKSPMQWKNPEFKL